MAWVSSCEKFNCYTETVVAVICYKLVNGTFVVPQCKLMSELLKEYVDFYGRENNGHFQHATVTLVGSVITSSL